MKRFTLAFLLSTTVLAPAFADEFKFQSSVDAVTVFPRGAEVERLASGSLTQGEHTVLVENLPANISPDSVRVEGLSEAGVSIGSVDVRQVYLSRNLNSEERLKLEREIETLSDEHLRLEQVVADTTLQRKMLENLISNAGKPVDGASGNSLSALEVADLLDGAATRLDAYAKRTINARASQRSIQRDIRDLQGQIAQIAPVEELRSVVAINLNSAAPGDASFKIKYAIRDAGWQAIYDAKLNLGSGDTPAMDIVRRANVLQSTSESWEGVSLTLSTARPSTRTFAPELTPYEINQEVPMPRAASKMRSIDQGLQSQYLSDSAEIAAAPVEEARPIGRQEVAMNVGGFQATYSIPGKVTITNTGETKSVVMGEDSFDVAVSAYSVPRLDPAAYLIANFELNGSATYLPGPVLLSRDGAYIGRGNMPMLAPGDAYDLSFGQDDFIIVERVETDRKEGESGIISASLTDERGTKTTIKNLHDFAMDVKIVDRLPVSNHEDIVVTMASSSTKPTSEDVDGKRGILNWDMTIAAGQSEVIDFGYKISWPKAMQISQLN